MKIKKMLALALACSLTAGLLAGCGGSTATNSPAATGGDKPTYQFSIATGGAESLSLSDGLRAFAEKAKELSDGRMQFEIYYSGALGTDRESTESVAMGDLAFSTAAFSTVNTVTNDPRWLFTDLAWFVTDRQVYYDLFEMDAYAELIADTAEKKNILILGESDLGYYGVCAMKEIHGLADVKGLKIRATELRPVLDMFDSIGVQTTTMAYSEVYTAMQQGTIDGTWTGLNPLPTAGLSEVGTNFTIFNSSLCYEPLMMDYSLFQSMNEEDQNIILEAAKEFDRVGRASAAQESEDAIAKIEADNCKVYTLNESEIAEFAATMDSIYTTYGKEMNAYDHFMDKVMADLEQLGYQSPAAEIMKALD